jgi:hypothetical protein
MGIGILRPCLVLGFLALSPAFAESISGTYVGQGPDAAFLLQIVETPGGILAGRCEQTTLQPTGELNHKSAAVTGASDGKTAVVTLKLPGAAAGSITASGTIQGSMLHLSGRGDGGQINLDLVDADEIAYRNHVSGLAGKAHQMTDARTRAEQLAHLDKITKDMVAYSTAAVEQLAKFPPIQQRYRTITEWMKSALGRQGAIFGDGQASVARSQDRNFDHSSGYTGRATAQ